MRPEKKILLRTLFSVLRGFNIFSSVWLLTLAEILRIIRMDKKISGYAVSAWVAYRKEISIMNEELELLRDKKASFAIWTVLSITATVCCPVYPNL